MTENKEVKKVERKVNNITIIPKSRMSPHIVVTYKGKVITHIRKLTLELPFEEELMPRDVGTKVFLEECRVYNV